MNLFFTHWNNNFHNIPSIKVNSLSKLEKMTKFLQYLESSGKYRKIFCVKYIEVHIFVLILWKICKGVHSNYIRQKKLKKTSLKLQKLPNFHNIWNIKAHSSDHCLPQREAEPENLCHAFEEKLFFSATIIVGKKVILSCIKWTWKYPINWNNLFVKWFKRLKIDFW